MTVIDRDPLAREKQVKVKVTAPYQPVLPGEIAPGTGLHAVDFTGLTITPYVNEGRAGGRARMAYSIRATGLYAQGKAPAGSASAVERAGSFRRAGAQRRSGRDAGREGRLTAATHVRPGGGPRGRTPVRVRRPWELASPQLAPARSCSPRHSH